MNKKRLKVYHASGITSYSSFIPNRQIVDDIKEADLVIFEGGQDINPEIYGEKPHPTTSFTPSRDNRELKVYKEALALKKPMFGTCRGLQLLTALQKNGKLIQHQSHPGRHYITTKDGREFMVNSIHHQAAFPYEMAKDEYEILATSNNLSAYHKGANDEEMLTGDLKEVEALYLPKINALGVQWHPEMLYYEKEAYKAHFDWLYEQIKDKLKITI